MEVSSVAIVKIEGKYIDCRWSLFGEEKYKYGRYARMSIKDRGSNDVQFLDNNLLCSKVNHYERHTKSNERHPADGTRWLG